MLKYVNFNSCLPSTTVSLLYVTETLRWSFLNGACQCSPIWLPQPWFHGKALIGQIVLAVRNQYIRA